MHTDIVLLSTNKLHTIYRNIERVGSVCRFGCHVKYKPFFYKTTSISIVLSLVYFEWGACSETTSCRRVSSCASIKLPRTALVKQCTSLMRVLFTHSTQPSRVNQSTSLRAWFARVSMGSHNFALEFTTVGFANGSPVSCFCSRECKLIGSLIPIGCG